MPSDNTQCHVLVVCERWCDAAPNTSLSNMNHNVIGSLESTKRFNVSTLFTDEIYAANQSVDDALNRMVALAQPDLLFWVPLPGHPINPSVVVLQSIRMKWQVPIVAMYCDTALPRQVLFADEYAPGVDLNVAVDCYSVYPKISKTPDLWLALWSPQDTRIFYATDGTRDIDVSFVGSVAQYPDRQEAMAYLAANGIEVFTGGGQREGGLPVDGYAELLRRSKISLNFSKVFAQDHQTHQFKGRVLESILCGALVLEPNNQQTPRWLSPGIDYDTFGSGPELIEKISGYLENEPARIEMTTNAMSKAQNELSAARFWDAIFSRIAESK